MQNRHLLLADNIAFTHDVVDIHLRMSELSPGWLTSDADRRPLPAQIGEENVIWNSNITLVTAKACKEGKFVDRVRILQIDESKRLKDNTRLRMSTYACTEISSDRLTSRTGRTKEHGMLEVVTAALCQLKALGRQSNTDSLENHPLWVLKESTLPSFRVNFHVS